MVLPFAIEGSILYAAPLVYAGLFALLNRVRGSGKTSSTLVCASMGWLYAPAIVQTAIEHWGKTEIGYLWAGTIGGIATLSFLLLLKPSWGEIFPDLNSTSKESFAWLVRPLTDLLAGYPYTVNTTTPDAIFWKVTAWGPRFGVYGLPIALLVAIAVKSLAPVIEWLLFGFLVGHLMRRERIRHDMATWLAHAEIKVGAALGAVLGLMLLS